MRVRYALSALADIDSILAYLDVKSPGAARRVSARFQAVERMLTHSPQSGAQTRLAWLRRIATVPYPYMIFYEVTGTEVIVHAVRHGARHPASMPDHRNR